MVKIACMMLVLLGVFRSGHAIKCYNSVSTSLDDQKAVDKNSFAVCNKPDGNAFNPICIKKVVQDSIGKMNITRLCLSVSTGKECDAPSTNYKVLDCVMCAEDFCNSSNPLSINIVLPLILITGLIFTAK